ncbi:MAG TPA: glutamine--tRNA ligase/YqeY domain fusion protein [Thermoanaerobaculia bacterium]|nr:glutamine--tRNA ligase/YqeY domain fusion protein [Thermoanaerobaculia bacterium]HQR67169.1 glutamine--tRNA ligase/YqeY domain fusion protein [Thermoanaerobaculia bacterium]
MDDARTPSPAPPAPGKDFIREILDEDRRTGKHGGKVATRFPPEPNGYLHIGHAKSICLNFGVAREYGGTCNLRFDDTNPLKEDVEYVESIEEDVRWLGFEWHGLFYASDYFERLYEFGETLIRTGKAFVCDLSAEEVRKTRGTLTEPGRNSPYRDRSVEESLDLFRRMRSGEFPDGSRTLRAKIDMASPNINLRDPALFRIRKATHHRTGDAWCIYPMYDYAHAISDWIEGITHSLCTLEFEDHRPLYDWCLEALDLPNRPRQIEFARLNLTYTLLSKRKLLHLVTGGHVRGWDDPRMPTIAGLRRRGYTPEAIREFCDRIGLAKRDSVVEVELLEHCLRDDLNRRAPRFMGVLDPLRVVLTNFPEGKVEELEAVNNPEDPAAGTRRVPFSRELLIERDDFREVPPPKYHRLSPGQEVRLRWGYIIRCDEVVKDPATGAVTELRCTVDPATRGGDAPGRKVKGTIHWVSAPHALPAEVRLYDRLFSTPDPDAAPAGKDFLANLNPESLVTRTGCRVEPALAGSRPLEFFQLERIGYFCVDPDSAPGAPVFNRSVSLRDTWAKIEKKSRAGG